MALDSWKDDESRAPVDMDREINFENMHVLRLPIDQERLRLQEWADAQEHFRLDQGGLRKESALAALVLGQAHEIAANDLGQMEAALLLATTRALLWVRSASEAKDVAMNFVSAVGGECVLASADGDRAIQTDISFGFGQSIYPTAPSGSEARALLERHIPGLVGDIYRALEIGTEVELLNFEANLDPLTHLPNRRMLDRALGRLDHGDVLIMLDLDDFKIVNDVDGHSVGDVVLRSFGSAMNETVRGRDLVGRFGGDEFMIILTGYSDPDSFLLRLKELWEIRRPRPVTFSAGIARAGKSAAINIAAADAAMYEAKKQAGNSWVHADQGEQLSR